MQVRNNEVNVVRGETWTMSRRIENRDGSPFIVCSELTNPYWLITITSDYYRQSSRYIINKWLNLKDFPRFKITQPVNISDYGFSFSDKNPTLPFINQEDPEIDFTGDETTGYANVALFYEKDADGVINYKYWEYINNEKDDYEGKWVDYKCLITTTFGNNITSQWTGQNYYYSIDLVSGSKLDDKSNKPIDVIDYSRPILKPTKLVVGSDLKGGGV